MTAEAIFKKYADKDGLVSTKDLEKEGWTTSRAEDEGIIVKETFFDLNKNK